MSGARPTKPLRRAPLLVAGSAILVLVLGAILGRYGLAPIESAPADVERFLHHYFQSWSEADMPAYGRLFHEQAVIHAIDGNDRLSRLDRDQFLRQQADAHARAPVRMTETMESFRVVARPRAAQVTVDWRLVIGPRQSTGIDHFTLLRDAHGDWKIVGLLFYAHPTQPPADRR